MQREFKVWLNFDTQALNTQSSRTYLYELIYMKGHLSSVRTSEDLKIQIFSETFPFLVWEDQITNI